LLDKLAESSIKHQESNEENNKLKDQLKSYQDHLKYVINDNNIYLIFKSTTVVSSNTADGEMYSILHYVTKFVSDMRQIGSFLVVYRFPSPIKLMPRYNWNIVESGVKYHSPNTQKHWHERMSTNIMRNIQVKH